MNGDDLILIEAKDHEDREVIALISQWDIEIIDMAGNSVAEYMTSVDCFQAMKTLQ